MEIFFVILGAIVALCTTALIVTLTVIAIYVAIRVTMELRR